MWRVDLLLDVDVARLPPLSSAVLPFGYPDQTDMWRGYRGTVPTCPWSQARVRAVVQVHGEQRHRMSGSQMARPGYQGQANSAITESSFLLIYLAKAPPECPVIDRGVRMYFLLFRESDESAFLCDVY